ncbi:ABC transporter ATP-binding protein [Turicibacter sanguinis]|uniref:ATP-binding cassette domain-containing protein n=1 Tax=Turicibacter sanguinis TaxID=154288 RepID=A0A6I3NH73_9FIRM|nr:ABC transporter ATP-binding protein [Turicibacter sanguinis]KAB3586208.1 ABC transporter ATP-binding protein [Phocaeicola vulgatus]MTK70680.1 ATP-binding cassette domain-containing protein [Turicibacter sanguinis]MTK81903.1 ATP-binding cassette domain-containing protein [Turicibacter sanguinis]MTK83782.1 ATP-binding cassette domain-containing protein [Turicibacter sanguinis]MTK86291.1 ATP-binding cassette domain-containing protein [Turicibacter sanguinis]
MFKKFISYYRNHLGLFILDMIAALLMAGIDLVYPYFTGIFMDDYIPNGKIQSMVIVSLTLLILFIIRLICSHIVNYWGHIMGCKMEFDMRQDLFKKFQSLNFSYYDENKTGVIMSRLVGDLRDITELAHHGPEDIFISLIMIIGSFIILFNINAVFTLSIFPIIILIIIFSMWRRNAMMQGFRATRKTQGEINAQIESSIGGIRLTKSFTNEDYEYNKFTENNLNYANSWKNALFQMSIFSSGNTFLIDILNLILLIIGGILVYNNTLTFGDFTAFLLYINFLIKPIQRLINFMQQFQTGWAGFERFYEIIQLEPKIKSKENAIYLNNPKGNIIFNHVNFKYEANEEHVLTDFNINIESGKKIALVGESGVGKSTISLLIPRFYDVTSGEILIDDINIKDYELSSLRKNIGHVQQEVYIFYGNIRDNILYGNPQATEEEIIIAAKKARIHDFIMSLENGYDTIVGERGVKLSGGQKQRIAIARVFLKNPAILILDEATSALDNITEMLIQEALEDLTKGRTSIIIAHRLSTIKEADEILVLSKNGISERGTHEELLNKQGYYAELYNTQFKNL